jgi:hypothetical protein
MALFEKSTQPGAPFVLASLLSLWAFLHCFELPAEADSYTMRLDAYARGHDEADSLLSYSCSDAEHDDSDLELDETTYRL